MGFTSGNDENILQAEDLGVVGAGLGDDIYILAADKLPAGKEITISDADGANILRLVGGLTITSSKVDSDTIQLTLSSGAIVNILGASSFSYEVGGTGLATSPVVQDFTTFVTNSMGLAAVPAAGEVVDGPADLDVNADGSTSASSGSGETFEIAASAGSVSEGNAVSFTVTNKAGVVAADTVVNYTITGVAAEDLTGGALTGSVTILAGQSTATFSVTPLNDNTVESDRTMTVTLDADTSAKTNVTVQDPPVGSTFTLTNGTDNAQANVFEANMVFTPSGTSRINSLQDEDVLTGTGDNPTLNATLGNIDGLNAGAGGTTITPEMIGIETVNVAFTGSGATAVNTLDMQDTTGTAAVNVTRISDPNNNVTIDNLTTVPANLSLTNTNSPAGQVAFTFTDLAARGTEDATTMTLSNVVLNDLVIQEKDAPLVPATPDQGIETINLVSSGSDNRIGTLWAEDLKTLNISGTTDLTLGATATTNRAGTTITEATRYIAGLANAAGSLTAINTADFEGKLTLHLGNEIDSGLDNTSGLQAQLNVTGGKADDTFVLTAGANVGGAVGNTDIIDGKEGNNKMIIVGGATVAAAATPNVKGIQNLEIRTGHDLGVGADAVTINANAFDSLANIYVRNEGMDQVLGNWVSAAEAMTVNLNNLTEAQAKAITLAHGTTGNSTVANNIVNVTYKTAGTANEAQVTLVDGVNNDPVFNAQLNLASAEKVTLVDSDTESNTIHLADATRTQAGSTLTILPGEGSDAGKFMNLDSSANGAVALGAMVNNPVPGVVSYDYLATAGYGYVKDGAAGSNTSYLTSESAERVANGGIATRDAEAATVFYGTVGVAGDGVTRHSFENIDAATYEGDVIVRVGDITRADGVSSMNIKTGTGNDTIIFDQIASTSAGFTSGDTVAAGTGTDTLVLDGNTATVAGTPRINHQTSEWDNLTGIDVLRFGNNAGVGNVGNAAQVANAGGAYYARIDNDFIRQSDVGNRLTVINNDGELSANTESDLVLDLRGLSQDKWVTFQGANSNGFAGLSSNRLVMDDVSANQNMILDGGDTDVRVNTTVGYVAQNNNVYEVRNTANVSISDLSQTSNFGLIDFTNDQATAQTLTLTLNNTIVEALVDASSTASATLPEVLNVIATDGILATQSNLNIDARQVSGLHALNVTGSLTGDDVVYVDANVGGTGSVLHLGAGLDTVYFSGSATTFDTGNYVALTNTFTAAGAAGTINLAAGAPTGSISFGNAGGSTVYHVLQDVDTAAGVFAIENFDLGEVTGITLGATALTGAATTKYIGGTNSAVTTDVITGGIGMATAYGYAGNDTITLAATTLAGLIGSGGAPAGAIAGSTVIDGGAGDDTITGSNVAAIADRIIGGTGIDGMTGGLGVDTYVFNAGDSGITATTADTIADFATTVDKLDFTIAGTAANFVDGGTGIPATTYAVALAAADVAFTPGGAARYYFDNDGTNGYLFADLNGDGTTDLSINLTGVTALVFGDII